jgi:hypothetical protein
MLLSQERQSQVLVLIMVEGGPVGGACGDFGLLVYTASFAEESCCDIKETVRRTAVLLLFALYVLLFAGKTSE